MIFESPWWFLALVTIPLLVFFDLRGVSKTACGYGSASLLRAAGSGRWIALRWAPLLLRMAALTLVIVALARPQTQEDKSQRTSEGLDIVLVVDTSESMRALDFVINGERMTRLAVVKSVLAEFISARQDDRLGIVVFGTEAFTQAPLTLDHEVLTTFLRGIEPGMAGANTAIGEALGVAVNRLKDLEAKSKVVILLTDGENTAGRIEPLTAANAAKALGVKVYTIGVGTNGVVPVLLADGSVVRGEMRIDEATLKRIADSTQGQYFRAQDTETLRNVYETIDKLEKTRVQTDTYGRRTEIFSVLVWLALALLILEALFSLSRFRRIP